MQSIEDYVIRKLNQKFPNKCFVWEHYVEPINFSQQFQIIIDGKYTVMRGTPLKGFIEKYVSMGAEKFRTEHLLRFIIPSIVQQIEVNDLNVKQDDRVKYLV
jgi:hypothetical protein